MISCNDTPNKVMRYVDKKIVSSYALLSNSYKSKVVYSFRHDPTLTNKANIRFMDFAEKAGIVVFYKGCNYYDESLSEDPIAKLDLSKSEDFAAWITTKGVKQGECTVVKYFNWIYGDWFKDVTTNIHFE